MSQPLKVGAWGIPANWTWIDVASAADTTSGGTPRRDRPEHYGGRIPWLKSGELRDRTVFEVEEYITEEGLRNSNAKVFPPGTLCIALYGATVGKLAILGVGSATNQAICGIFPAAGIDPRFLFRFFELIRPQLIELGKGGAQPNISQGIVRGTFFPLAPTNEQKRIVAEIEKQFTRLDAAVAALKRVQANLKRYRATLLKAACEGRLVPTEAEVARREGRSYETGDQLLARILKDRRARWEADQLAKMVAAGRPPKDEEWKKKYKEPSSPDMTNLPELPRGWTWATWDQLSNWVTYGFTRPMPHLEDGVPIVTAKHVANGRINFGECDLTSCAAFAALSEKDRPVRGDILITKDGSIGRGAVVDTDQQFCINQSVAVVWLRSCPCDRQFLLAVIASPLTQKPIWAKARGVAIQHLSITDFARMPVPLPPLAEQKRISLALGDHISVIEAVEAAATANLIRCARLRQSVLKSAFEGKLVPQDPNDEPASVLLEHIRAQRAANATKAGNLDRQHQRRPMATTVT